MLQSLPASGSGSGSASGSASGSGSASDSGIIDIGIENSVIAAATNDDIGGEDGATTGTVVGTVALDSKKFRR